MAGGHSGILGGGVDSRCNQTNLATTTTNNAKKMIRPCRYSNACVETQESNLEATEKKNRFILCVLFYLPCVILPKIHYTWVNIINKL